MKYTHDEKLHTLTSSPPYFEDEEAEKLAKKLTGEEIFMIERNCKEFSEQYAKRWAQELLKLKPKKREQQLRDFIEKHP